MDIGTLAASIVAVLAPYLAKAGEEFAKEAGKIASTKITAIYQIIKDRFHNQPVTSAALAELEAAPDDVDAQAALRLQLKKQMEADPTFADSLHQLLRDMGQDKQAAGFLTQVYGNVGKIINIGEAREIFID